MISETDKSLCRVDRVLVGMSGPGVVDVSHVNEDMLDLMNKARASRNIAPLVSHSALVHAAVAHAQDMADHNELSHYGLSVYSTWADRCLLAGYPDASLMNIGENVGGGQTSAAMLMGDYSQSPGHWAAIMNPEAQHTGAAAATGSSGWTYWSSEFGWGAPNPIPNPDPTPIPTPIPVSPKKPRPWWLPKWLPW